jgi:hypothetical protein
MRFLVGFFIVLCLSGVFRAHEGGGPRLFETITHEMNCEDAMVGLDLLFSEISSNGIDNHRAVAIYYEGDHRQARYTRGGELKSERVVPPVFGEVQNRVRWLQNYVNFRRFPKERIAFLSGGYRKRLAIDLWIVPDDSPGPKPETDVDAVKFRRGSFSSFSCL